MPVFHRPAYEAALKISGRKLPIPGDSEFEEWESTFVVLDRLKEAERCDALYADWVLQLHFPGGGDKLTIRNHLLKGGALAANYLAELAQNADDAADGDEAKLCIHYYAPWLFVGNNGRKVTSSNLLGLSRFFIHCGRDGAGDIIKLNDTTIGKFGIGFKSCYRIAREVLVTSWDDNGDYAFRLPIVTKGDSTSFADVERWQLIREALSEIGHRVKICTPSSSRRPGD